MACLAQLMLVLDLTVVNVALPVMAAELGLSRTTTTWAIGVYALLFGGFMVLGGRLVDWFGARPIMLTGLGLFVTGSLVAGSATEWVMLLAGRAVQGLGAAALSPGALTLVTTTFDAAKRSRALSVWAATGGVGATFGVLLGGLLTGGPGWRWIFFINVPVGVVLLILLPTAPRARAFNKVPRHHLDAAGALLVTVGTALALTGLVGAGERTLLATAVILTAAGGSYLLLAVVERRVAKPLLDPNLVGRGPVLAGAALMGVATAVLVGNFFLLSFYLQQGRGLSAVATGVAFLPTTLAVGLGAHLGGRALTSRGPRRTAMVPLLIGLVGTAGVVVGLHSPVLVVLGVSLTAGALGAVVVVASTTAVRDVGPADVGLVSATVNTSHELGAAFGVAAVATAAHISARLMGAVDIGRFTSGFVTSSVGLIVAIAVASVALPSDVRPNTAPRLPH